MALIAVASAKGAPGVTTLAVALAALFPRPALLADLDPAGGDVMLRYPAPDGSPLDPDRGLLSLGAAVRRDVGRDRDAVSAHLQVLSGGLEVLVGASSPEQMSALGPVWPALGRILQDLPGRDVIADCGRVSAGSPTLPVLQAADVLVLLARDTVEQLAHLRSRLIALGPLLGHGANPAVVVVAPERRSGATTDVRRLLDSSGLHVPVLGTIADDPKGARRMQGAGARSAGRSTLVRSARSLLPDLFRLADVAQRQRAGAANGAVNGAANGASSWLPDAAGRVTG